MYLDEKKEQKRVREEGDRNGDRLSVQEGRVREAMQAGACRVGGNLPLGRHSMTGDRSLVQRTSQGLPHASKFQADANYIYLKHANFHMSWQQAVGHG